MHECKLPDLLLLTEHQSATVSLKGIAMTIPFRPVLFPLVLGATLLAACSEAPGTAPAQPVPQVAVVTLTSEPVTLRRELPGRTTPYLVAEVRPQVSGLIEERLFTEGGRVEAGAALYQLDDASYRAAANSARASLERARASLESARLTKERADRLKQTGAISQQDHDELTATYLEAKASVAVAQATLEGAQVTLDDARITAPISGRIGKSSVTRGALVTANQASPLATIQQLDPMYVDLTRSATEWLSLRQQLASGELTAADDVPVTLLLEDGSEYSYQGTLAFADVTVNPTTGSFALRAEVPNPDDLLLPGMYVRAVISLGERTDGVLVPQRGVMRDPTGQTYVMVVNRDNVIEQKSIRVSQTIGDDWLVESGIGAGDRVVIEGLQKIRPGAQVTVVASTPSDTNS